ncbi:MAG: hypothetical protein R3E39_03605 [Anaerolineae bacterium]
MSFEDSLPEQKLGSAKSRQSLQRIILLSGVILGAIIFIPFIIGLLLSFSDLLEVTALRIAYLRNILFILIILEGIIIITGLGILIVQISRIVNMVKKEVSPVIFNAQQTIKTAKVTAEFVGNNVKEPIVQTGAFVAGLRSIIRDVGGIRRAMQPNQKAKPEVDERQN